MCPGASDRHGMLGVILPLVRMWTAQFCRIALIGDRVSRVLRKVVATSAVSLLSAVGLAATPSQASAMPNSETISTVTHVSTDLSDIPTPAVLYGRYATLSQCISVGSKGEFHGRWLSWSCYDNRPIDVQLWVVYS